MPQALNFPHLALKSTLRVTSEESGYFCGNASPLSQGFEGGRIAELRECKKPGAVTPQIKTKNKTHQTQLSSFPTSQSPLTQLFPPISSLSSISWS